MKPRISFKRNPPMLRGVDHYECVFNNIKGVGLTIMTAYYDWYGKHKMALEQTQINTTQTNRDISKIIL